MKDPCINDCTIYHYGCEQDCFALKVYKAYQRGKRQEKRRLHSHIDAKYKSYYTTAIEEEEELKGIAATEKW